MDQTLGAECLDLEHEDGMGSLSGPSPFWRMGSHLKYKFIFSFNNLVLGGLSFSKDVN